MSSMLTQQRPVPPMMNTWEVRALNYTTSHDDSASSSGSEPDDTRPRWQSLQDPLIYPGLYSGSGFDLMKVLLSIIGRPNPQIVLGPVDCSASLIVCDLDKPDCPIIYVTDSFCHLTGYLQEEVIGRNCRFLQNAPNLHPSTKAIKDMNRGAVKRMREAMAARNEIQIELTNYKKNGEQFLNLLTIIPIHLDGDNANYAVGFQSELI